jgi:hypothetical protein
MRAVAWLLFVSLAGCASIAAEDCDRRCGTAQERADLAKACENLDEAGQGNCRAGIVGVAWLCRQFCGSAAVAPPEEAED